MDDLLRQLDSKKRELSRLRLPGEQLANLRQWYKVELTYTSNALEGNTLNRRQTAQVVDKSLSVAGKSLTEHLEAMNHAQAIDYIWRLAGKTGARDIDAKTILNIHSLILDKIDDTNAGRLRHIPVRVVGSKTVFPNHARVSAMMDDLVQYIQTSEVHTCLKASQAHLQLVSIHPFIDGNGRTARLLMNLLLLQDGWPPVIIAKTERLRYLKLLEEAQTQDRTEPFHIFILQAAIRSFNIYLKPDFPAPDPQRLFKIGDLARLSGEPVSTLRFWTDQGILRSAETSPAKYRWYAPESIKQVKRIRKLQNRRFTIKEIKSKLDRT